MTLADPGNVFFPYNVVGTLQTSIATIDSDIQFIPRKINFSDPDQSVAICPIDWIPDVYEIGRNEPSTQIYLLYIQSMIIDPDQGRGLRVHTYLAKRIRELLARSVPLHIALMGLETTDSNGVTEKLLQHYAGSQSFHDSEQDGNWYYLSTLEFRIKTQIID